MGLKVGIIGLPNVGKSTLFNAIMGKQQALTAPYPFATVEPNVGVVEVLDERLIKLRDALYPRDELWVVGCGSGNEDEGSPRHTHDSQHITHNSQPPIVPATVTFVDIAGLVKGAAEGQGLGNQFLSHIRDVDLILHVLRDFDEGIPRAADSKNPEHDAEIVRTELALKDLEVMEKAGKKEEGKRKKEEGEMLAEKPVIYAVNVGEEKLSHTSFTTATDKPTFYFSAKVEEEISKMPRDEQKEYLKVYGLETSGLDRIISECFQALGLISFFTAGKIEVRAWPVRKDSPAPKAAGVIHSDFEKLFIRVEVIGWEKLAAAGSWTEAKNRGRVRTEGRDYIVKDGEVCNFLIGK